MKLGNIANTLVLTAAVLIAAGSARADNKGCSNASLKGSFGYKGTGTIVSPAEIAGPIDNVMVETFDGNGNLTATGVLTQNGSVFQVTATGKYTVNNDCTGTYTVNYSLGFTSTFYFVMDDSESELQIICTDAGVVLDGVARRQFPIGDWRQ